MGEVPKEGKFDAHTHYFPLEARELLKKGVGHVRLAPPDEFGRTFLYDSETGHLLTYFSEASAHVDLEARLKEMDSWGVALQVLSVSPPNVDLLSGDEAVALARAINDGLARAASRAPDRLEAFATLPITDPSEAEEEAKRVSGDLGIKGILLSSNAAKAFYDQDQRYWRLFRVLRDLNMVVMIHPTEPVTWRQVGEDYNLNLLYAWPFDTTISAARLVFSGLVGGLPGLKVVLSHGGGMIPYYAGRLLMLGNDFRGNKGEKRFDPRQALKDLKGLYYDAAVFSAASVRLLIDFAGADHVLFGTDYPFGPGRGSACYAEAIEAVERATTSEERERIYRKNLQALIGPPRDRSHARP
ncbi:MAG: amidohydrolase family protein [Candidatus Marsarchaeota archaeon]